MGRSEMTSRAVPPLRSIFLRITFVAPLWGVPIATGLLAILAVADVARNGVGLSDLLSFFGVALIPAFIIGYPIGLVVAFLSALLLVLVVRRFGWSQRNALLTACVPGAVLAGITTVGGSGLLFGLGAFFTCLGAAALTWWSSLRGLLIGSREDVASVFS